MQIAKTGKLHSILSAVKYVVKLSLATSHWTILTWFILEMALSVAALRYIYANVVFEKLLEIVLAVNQKNYECPNYTLKLMMSPMMHS